MPKIGTDAHAPGQGVPDFELLLDGLTFDAFVYSPPVRGGPVYPAQQDVISPGELASRCAMLVVPGPHLTGAPRALPVLRGQWRLGARLCEALPQIAIAGWPPSGTLLEADVFAASAGSWKAGTTLPAAGMITLRGAFGNALQSAGLAYFTGQELRVEAGLAADNHRASRLALRIAEMLVHRGPLLESEQFAGPDGGTLRLEPSANGRFVRVWEG